MDTKCVTYGLSLATAFELTVFDQSLKKDIEMGVLTEQDLSTLQTEGATSFADVMVNLANQLIPYRRIW